MGQTAKSILSKFVDKKSVFVNTQTTPLVLDDLKGLKNSTDMFGAAFVEKSPVRLLL